MERSDHKTMTEAVRSDPDNFMFASMVVRDNKEIALLAAAGHNDNNSTIFAHLSPRLKNDYDVLKAFAKKIGPFFTLVPYEFRKDIDISKAAMISSDGGCICEVPFNLRDCEEFATWSLKRFPHSYANLSDRLRNDVHILGLGMEEEPEIFRYAPDALRNDPKVVAFAISRLASNLRYASDRLRDDEDIVKLALIENSRSLEYASDRLRDNEQIVKFAVVRGEDALYFASDRLKDNEDIANLAITRGLLCGKGVACFAASKRITQNRVFVLKCIVANEKIPDEILYMYRDDDEIFEMLVDKDPLNLEYASARIKDGPLAIKAVERKYTSLLFASERIRSDSNLVLRALEYAHTPSRSARAYGIIENNVDYIPEQLRSDYNFALEAVKIRGSLLFLLSDVLKENKDIVIAAAQEYPKVAKYLSDELKNDEDIACACVSKCGMTLQYFSEEIKDKEHIVFKAFENDEVAISHISNRLQNLLKDITDDPSMSDADRFRLYIGGKARKSAVKVTP